MLFRSREPSDTNYGRATQAAAYCILAKMYLNAEAWFGTPMYDKASTVSIIASDFPVLSIAPYAPLAGKFPEPSVYGELWLPVQEVRKLIVKINSMENKMLGLNLFIKNHLIIILVFFI